MKVLDWVQMFVVTVFRGCAKYLKVTTIHFESISKIIVLMNIIISKYYNILIQREVMRSIRQLISI